MGLISLKMALMLVYRILPVVLMLIFSLTRNIADAGITSRYARRLQTSDDIPADSLMFSSFNNELNAPEQVHLTQGDYNGHAVIVTWITPSSSKPNMVGYGLKSGDYTAWIRSSVTTYTFHNYTSGFIHQAKLDGLKPDTQYYYGIGGKNSWREFTFTAPPEVGADVPYVFGVMADLGQTVASAQTIDHYIGSSTSGMAVLFAGDLSYADDYFNSIDSQERWNTWLRLIEKSTAYQAWIWAAGDHEIEIKPELGETEKFKPFSHRIPVPHEASGSKSNLFYAVRRASAHIIILSPYVDFGQGSDQYEWLQQELTRVNRSETPWLIVLIHIPWYNSNTHHYMEGDPARQQMEHLLVQAKTDVVFSGHVHAYERSHRVSSLGCNVCGGCTPVLDESAPVYINLGDGGNCEGLVGLFVEPQPDYSAMREASYGHGMLDIKNRTHALFYWHRNEDGDSVIADSLWLVNRYWRSN